MKIERKLNKTNSTAEGGKNYSALLGFTKRFRAPEQVKSETNGQITWQKPGNLSDSTAPHKENTKQLYNSTLILAVMHDFRHRRLINRWTAHFSTPFST